MPCSALLTSGGDRRPAGGGDVEDVRLGRRRRGGARDPVERLVERAPPPARSSRRRRAGLGDRARRARRRARPGTRPSRARSGTRGGRRPGWRRHQTKLENRASVSPFQPISSRHQRGRQRAAPAPSARRARRRAPARSDQISIGRASRACGGSAKRRGSPVRADDRQHHPVELREAVDEQVAPGADAAHDVGVRALGGQQDARAPGRPGPAQRCVRRKARARAAGPSQLTVRDILVPVARVPGPARAAAPAGRPPRRAPPDAPRTRPSSARSRGRSRSATRG